MSTGYNRKRTEPRLCRHVERPPYAHNESKLIVSEGTPCGRRADTASRYCDDHRLRTASVEGPMGRKLRLQHQANQVAEAGKLAGVTHVKQPRWFKERMRKAKYAAAMQTFLQALCGVTFVEKVKNVAKKLNPWAK